MRVTDLIPGMRIKDPLGDSHIYIGQCQHPLFSGFQLVIWRLANKKWSHDALLPQQDVGEIDLNYTDYLSNLREAIFTKDI